jgi:hypothetical protein
MTTQPDGATMTHTRECIDRGWWILHELDQGTPCGVQADRCDAGAVPDLSHAAALVLNAAITWEQAIQRRENDGRPTSEVAVHTATYQLRELVRAYMPLVAK